MQRLTFHVTSPAPREVWYDLLKSDPNTLVSQTPVWLDCMCAMGGYADASRLYELSGGKQLILPMVRQNYLLAPIATQASFPESWGIGGLVGSDKITASEVTSVLLDLIQQPSLSTSIRPDPLTGGVWAAAQVPGMVAIPRLAHVLDLDGGFDRVWTKRFDRSTRAKVHKAERSALVVECDTTGKLVPVFYDLFKQSIERWAHQQHEPLALARWRAKRRDPLRKFQLMAQVLGDACRFWVAWLDGQPVAAIMVLQGRNSHYTRGAMNKNLATLTRANELLHRLAIEDACCTGCRYYHMGESGGSDSLAQFKSQFGAIPYRYAEYRLERLPITKVDRWLRGFVKQLIGFKDA
jgi:hypothetical protein